MTDDKDGAKTKSPFFKKIDKIFFHVINAFVFKSLHLYYINMVQSAGIEPARECSHSSLKAARLPVPPRSHDGASGGIRPPFFGLGSRRSADEPIPAYQLFSK